MSDNKLPAFIDRAQYLRVCDEASTEIDKLRTIVAAQELTILEGDSEPYLRYLQEENHNLRNYIDGVVNAKIQNISKPTQG